jgi:hypothetical protein
MTDCTGQAKRRKGQKGMPGLLSMTDCTGQAKRRKGQKGMAEVGTA